MKTGVAAPPAATGIDIAEPIVMLAREYARSTSVKNAEFVVNTQDHRPFDDDAFDFTLGWIVLQHQPPALARRFLAELIRVTRPGGTLVFQLPAGLVTKSCSQSAWKRNVISILPNERVQQFHRLRTGQNKDDRPFVQGFYRRDVIAFAERHSAEVVAVIEDTAAGSTLRSFHYFVRPLQGESTQWTSTMK